MLAPSAARSLFRSVTSQITLINVLYFLGALIIIGAMTLFMTVGWGMWACAACSRLKAWVQYHVYGAVITAIARKLTPACFIISYLFFSRAGHNKFIFLLEILKDHLFFLIAEIFGGWGIFAFSCLYFAVFVYFGQKCWRQPHLKLAGGMSVYRCYQFVSITAHSTHPRTYFGVLFTLIKSAGVTEARRWYERIH